MEKILGTSKLTRKGQITVPKDVREKLGVGPKDIIVFVEVNGKIMIRKG